MSGMNFKNIPSGDQNRTPGFFAEVDNSLANTATIKQRSLIIAQITGAGTAVPNIPIISQGPSDAVAQGGAGSMLALMTAAYRSSDDFGEVWYLPLADAAGATAATGAILFSGPATDNGTLSLYIAAFETTYGLYGQLSVAVTAAMTAAQIATAVAAEINADTDLPVTAVVDGLTPAKVNLTAKNAGLAGNEIDIRFNYYGAQNGESYPTGVAAVVTVMSGGAGNPSLNTALGNLNDMTFDFIACAYNDAVSLNALKSFLGDKTGRWSWERMIYGHVFYAYAGTIGGLTTFGTGRNDPHASCMGIYDSPSPSWVWAVDVCGTAATSLRADPALPLQTLALSCVLAPPVASRFSQFPARNGLLFDGISTFTVDDDGTVRIENLITTYQENAYGQPDNSYLQVETLFTIMAVLRFLKTRITSKFGRMKLANNETHLPPGANTVTPNIIRGDQIAAYSEMIDKGWVTDLKAFIKGLIVERDTSNPSRINELFDPILMGGLRMFALLMRFRLQ